MDSPAGGTQEAAIRAADTGEAKPASPHSLLLRRHLHLAQTMTDTFIYIFAALMTGSHSIRVNTGRTNMKRLRWRRCYFKLCGCSSHSQRLQRHSPQEQVRPTTEWAVPVDRQLREPNHLGFSFHSFPGIRLRCHLHERWDAHILSPIQQEICWAQLQAACYQHRGAHCSQPGKPQVEDMSSFTQAAVSWAIHDHLNVNEKRSSGITGRRMASCPEPTRMPWAPERASFRTRQRQICL